MSVNRRLLTAAVSSLLVEIGFESADAQALETLIEMIQGCEWFLLIYDKIFLNQTINRSKSVKAVIKIKPKLIHRLLRNFQ